jgi:hypothetical protein
VDVASRHAAITGTKGAHRITDVLAVER